MRILHTSDWHLGRTLHGVDLLDHQRAFIDHLVEVVREHAVDVVVVAGDVYDRAVPAVPTVRLLSEALRRLSESAIVIVTPGNHDSAVRLGFAAELMRPGVHLLTGVDRLDVPVVVPFRPAADSAGSDSAGSDAAAPADAAESDAAASADAEAAASDTAESDPSLAGTAESDPGQDAAVAFYGLPYLDPDTARFTLADNPDEPLARSHEAVMGAALERVRCDLATRPGTRSVVIAHAFVVGGVSSESERDIRVGGVDAVPSGVFDGVDYVALGHLHGAQAVGGRGGGTARIRYSGSPLAFSFGEMNQAKSSVLVDLAPTGDVSTTLIPAPVPRRLAEITGTLGDLLDGRHDDLREAWLRVIVTDPVHPDHLFARITEYFPHALVVLHQPVGASVQTERRVVTVDTDPLEVAADFVQFATGGSASPAELAVLQTAYESARAVETSA